MASASGLRSVLLLANPDFVPNADVDVTIFITAGRMHNEAVHQNSTPARIAPRAVSGATALLEAVGFSIFILLF